MDTAFDCSRYRKHLSPIAVCEAILASIQVWETHNLTHQIEISVDASIYLYEQCEDLKSEETSKKNPWEIPTIQPSPRESVNFTHWHSTSGNPTGSMFQRP